MPVRQIPPANNPIADTGSISIEDSAACAELFARDNCKPRSKNALQLGGQELNVVLIHTFEQASIIAAVVCSLIVAGLLKGMIGVGMPVVALPLLSLFVEIKSAVMLLNGPPTRRRANCIASPMAATCPFYPQHLP